ncbi:transglutaminase domain-containing protein [uncultured Bacteroides sp.]|uniref:transglutaminase-like domain-containing protein n=1 Tax=uncultured Bacteroides sp. TaxID=162156 RepID=UPI002AABB05F|nr:transglutaminase domain-containing protein [uncultured Bacteroides sp.]
MKRTCWLGLCGVLLLSDCASRLINMDNSDQEKMNRTKIDFSKTKEQVTEYIRKYIPNVTEEQLLQWENEKVLECMIIDGKKMYFYNAAPNLFRINKEAIAIKLAKDGLEQDGKDKVNATHVPQVISEAKAKNEIIVHPVRMRVKYTLTVKPNAVPEGEIIRCWLPFPRTDQPRQTDVKLLNTSESQYNISLVEYKHSALYMEKKAEKEKPTVFSAEYEYTSSAEWHQLKPEDIKPYKKETSLYKEYTSEREKHIRFTPRIKELAQQIVGSEQNPLLKVRKIYEWINQFPWASAREYSTLENIPEYVLDNKHGDCGQVSLLFITLARYCGIPAKFQSGFMMHPGGTNMHDWAQVYFEGTGWVPVDQSFGLFPSENKDEKYFFTAGIDSYRMIVNDDYSCPLYPKKKYPRSETVDFQRGEVEWRKGNLYFNQWKWNLQVEYLK